MAIEWNESMTTGVESIDNKNKEMFRQLAALKDAIDQGKSRFELSRLFDSFAKFAMRHFAEEELCMEDRHCPAAEENKVAHEDLLKKFDLFRDRFSSPESKPSMAFNFYETLARWLEKHVAEIDTQLLNGAAPSEPPVLASSC